MVENNIGSLPVVDADGRLVGVVSERDLIRELHDRGERLRPATIRAIMTLDPITCDIDDDVDAVMGQMSERRIAKVPVDRRRDASSGSSRSATSSSCSTSGPRPRTTT